MIHPGVLLLLGFVLGVLTGFFGVGGGWLLTPALNILGLEVPNLSIETKERLYEAMPPVGTSADNPVDLTLASVEAPEVYGKVIRILGRDESVDMMLAIGNGGEQFHSSITVAAKEINKPLVVAILMPLESMLRDYKLLMGSGIPIYPDPVRAAKALAKLADYAEFRRG
jgi:acyl-CoA synthetase (NDP forming)